MGCRSKFGYLIVEGMEFGPGVEMTDPETGEVTTQVVTVRPTHFKEPRTGHVSEVENPRIWIYPDSETAP